jgi:hypothetical protein
MGTALESFGRAVRYGIGRGNRLPAREGLPKLVWREEPTCRERVPGLVSDSHTSNRTMALIK